MLRRYRCRAVDSSGMRQTGHRTRRNLTWTRVPCTLSHGKNISGKHHFKFVIDQGLDEKNSILFYFLDVDFCSVFGCKIDWQQSVVIPRPTHHLTKYTDTEQPKTGKQKGIC